MSSATHINYNDCFLRISDKIDCLPVVHGDGIFSELVINRMIERNYDAVAVPLPATLHEGIAEGIEHLPDITAVCYFEPDGRAGYVSVNPCSSVVMAVKIAIQEHIPFFCIDYNPVPFAPDYWMPPDSFAIQQLSLEKYCAALTPFLPRPDPASQVQQRINYQAHQLHILELDFKRILFISTLHHWPYIKESFCNLYPPPEESGFLPETEIYRPDPNSLAVILGELPFFEYVYEYQRTHTFQNIFSPPDSIKELLVAARETYGKTYRNQIMDVTPKLFQIMLTYTRNLTLCAGRLTPDLYTLITAAKQTLGDNFAITVAETAKSYPIEYRCELEEPVHFTLDTVYPADRSPAPYFNRLEGRLFHWKNVPLKRRPLKKTQKKYRQLWNPYKMCSFPPEDIRIENFNTHVRGQALAILGEGLARSEKFTTSLKDGLDTRETLRNWFNKDIYVKEQPPSRGNVEVVCIFFEFPLDHEKYSWKTTWYAEHAQESTLCLVSTDISRNLIGPGIARSTYGALFLLYPPRFIPDVWQDPRFAFVKSIEGKLAAGALFHSKENYCTLIAPRPPNLLFKQLAKKYKKKWIYIPLHRFSGRLLRRLREFHILNGKEVRSYAADYISGFID